MFHIKEIVIPANEMSPESDLAHINFGFWTSQNDKPFLFIICGLIQSEFPFTLFK
jgi:hypothetical protein